MKMKQNELEKAINSLTGVSSQTISLVLETMKQVIIDEIDRGNEVSLISFGKFCSMTRTARRGVNPTNNEPILIPEIKVPKFRVSRHFKDIIKKTNDLS